MVSSTAPYDASVPLHDVEEVLEDDEGERGSRMTVWATPLEMLLSLCHFLRTYIRRPPRHVAKGALVARTPVKENLARGSVQTIDNCFIIFRLWMDVVKTPIVLVSVGVEAVQETTHLRVCQTAS